MHATLRLPMFLTRGVPLTPQRESMLSHRRWVSVCVLPALSSVLFASDGQAPAAEASAHAKDMANQRVVPALFSWGDFNSDGRLDLAAVSGEGKLQILLNAGDGHFEDVTERVGLSDVGNAALASWADYDGDGRLDLFVGARAGTSRLFQNEPGEVFIDVSVRSALSIKGAVESAQWFDYDGDGRLDLYLVTAERNELFRGLARGLFEPVDLAIASTGTASAQEAPIDSRLGPALEETARQLSDPNAARGGTHTPRSGPTRSSPQRSAGFFPSQSAPGGPFNPAAPASCFSSIIDQALPANCIDASTIPTLGLLYPISADLFVAIGGNVGIGTTSPAARLDVAGTARITNTLTLNPAVDQALDVSTGSIYKGGALFIHTKGTLNTAIGQEALLNVTSGVSNTASGYRALFTDTTGSRNTASGDRALFSNITGFGNVASGYRTLFTNTTGVRNTGSGDRALFANTSGASNTASGYKALSANTTGSFNTASGYAALAFNTTGTRNTASGSQALRLNTTGSDNTASGYRALPSNTTGFRNTAFGSQALELNTTGSYNTASGFNALNSNTTGNYNTASGFKALNSNSTGSRNTASGDRALFTNTIGTRNTANGYRALFANTAGTKNTGLGTESLSSNTTGQSNTASGYRALFTNTAGAFNTASGSQALLLNTTGSSNTASGNWALSANTTGSRNTASGAHALSSNTTGTFNTANGYQALELNTTGDDNTACGHLALSSNTVGNFNTSLGWQAMTANTTGSKNIALGRYSGWHWTTGDDNIAIGNVGVAAEAATIRIGELGHHSRTFIWGIRGVTTGIANAIPVVVDSAGQLGTVSSSRRFKKDIADMGDATQRLLDLRPVVFRYKQEQKLPSGEVPMEYGLIAEEVAEIFPDLVVYDEEGKPFTVKYHILSSMLLNEMKKQAHELIELHGQVAVQSEAHVLATAEHALELKKLHDELDAQRVARAREMDEHVRELNDVQSALTRLCGLESRLTALESLNSPAAVPADGR